MIQRLMQFVFIALLASLLGVGVAFAAHNTPPTPLNEAPSAIIDSDQSGPNHLIHALPYLTATTIITVNTTTDPNSTSLNFTCAYTSGALFFVSSDGLCSFRRALVEASNRPPGDRPILVAFDLQPSDPNYNASADTWAIMVDTGGNLLEIEPNNIIDSDGLVTVDGNTQPGGRTTGPKIIIKSDTSFQVSSNNNIIRNLAFQGDGNIIIREVQNVGKNNIVENIWVGLNDAGNDIAYETNIGSQPIGLKNGRIRIEQSDSNIVRNNIVAGSDNDGAISVQGSLNVIDQNRVGMRADGTIPTVATKCNFSSFFDPATNWYGGGGISVNGTFNQITNNIVAGMFNAGTDASARPPALDILGSDNLVSDNTVGKDTTGYEAGVCGLAIKVSGNMHDIINNNITDGGFAETGSGNTEGSIFVNESRFVLNQLTIQNNIVKGGQGLVVEFGPAVNTTDPLKTFTPARVTSLVGTAVSGTNGIYVDPATQNETIKVCGNCAIDLYADNLDNVQEALELVGTTTTDASGNWTATLNRALTDQEGVRTQSRTQASGTITGYGPQTSTAFSVLYRESVAPQDILFSRPNPIIAGLSYTVTVAVSPTNTSLPITYTIESTDNTPISSGPVDFVSVNVKNRTWPTAGLKEFTVRAENAHGFATKTFMIDVLEDIQTDFTVGAGGGSEMVTTTDGLDTTIAVPAGAVTMDTTFAYTETTNPAESTSGFNFTGRAFSLEASQAVSGIISVTLEYNEAELNGVAEADLVLYYWNESATPPQWADVLSACPSGAGYIRNTATNTITAPICHLSNFFLGAAGGHKAYLPIVIK